jgi:hypothetical protein
MLLPMDERKAGDAMLLIISHSFLHASMHTPVTTRYRGGPFSELSASPVKLNALRKETENKAF